MTVFIGQSYAWWIDNFRMCVNHGIITFYILLFTPYNEVGGDNNE
ncbi:MAG: hypothetical protein ACQES4_12240 [Bacillota bacterium]